MVTLIDVPGLWRTLIDGFEKLVLIALILLATVIFARITNHLLHRYFKRAQQSQRLKVDETTYRFLKHLLTGVIYVLGIGIALYTIPAFRTLSVSLFAGAGVIAVIAGFASQAAFSNIVAGVFISIFKPFRVGDRIKLGTGLYGEVEDITLRHTIIRTYENIRHVMPNSKISEETIENVDLGDKKICRFIEYGISYDSDIDKAMRIIRQELEKHPDCLDNRTPEQKRRKEPKVWVRVVGWGDSSINLRAGAWSPDSGASWRLKTDTLKTIKQRFDKEGILIPFPHRTVIMKNEEKTSRAGKRGR